MKIYLDAEYRCHTTSSKGYMAIETDFFDGKSPDYIEGFRYVPEGMTWTREDGTVFTGEMISAWKDWTELNAIQYEYVEQQNEELLSTIADMVEEVYTSDLEAMEA